MNIHFQNWSDPGLLRVLKGNGLEHGGRIIKAFATFEDPSIDFEKPELVVVDTSGKPFDEDEVFEYETRGCYTGAELERSLDTFDLGDLGSSTVRALSRFSNRHGFCQEAMAARNDNGWLIDHPFDEIDWIRKIRKPKDEKNLHLDIFFPASLIALRELVDYDDPKQVVSIKELFEFRRHS